MSTAFVPATPLTRSASRWLALTTAAALLLGTSAHAQQASSMEERLRTQLRLTTEQLQAAQNELAALKTGQPMPATAGSGAASSAEVAALKKELAQSRAELENERRARGRADSGNQHLQQQAQTLVEKANAQITQYRNAYDGLLKMARASESERQRLVGEAAQQRSAVEQCEAKNVQLYTLGQEILRAYETVDFGDVLSLRQPFAARTRVKYEETAQEYGDKLYQGRFDARAVTTPAAAAPAPTDSADPAAKRPE